MADGTVCAQPPCHPVPRRPFPSLDRALGPRTRQADSKLRISGARSSASCETLDRVSRVHPLPGSTAAISCFVSASHSPLQAQTP